MAMTTDETRPDATIDFEHQLTDLILSAFARGARIEQTWEITVPVSDAPNWTVTIEKSYDDDQAETGYEPTLLTEDE